MVDAPDLGSGAARRGGSSPPSRILGGRKNTIKKLVTPDFSEIGTCVFPEQDGKLVKAPMV